MKDAKVTTSQFARIVNHDHFERCDFSGQASKRMWYYTINGIEYKFASPYFIEQAVENFKKNLEKGVVPKEQAETIYKSEEE